MNSFFVLFFGVDVGVVVVDGDIEILGEILQDVAAAWGAATVE